MKKLIIGLSLLLAVLAGSACGQMPWEDSLRDVENATVVDPDYIVLTNNVDLHPNIVRLCTGGFGFWTTGRDFTAAQRLPEMDDFCATLVP